MPNWVQTEEGPLNTRVASYKGYKLRVVASYVGAEDACFANVYVEPEGGAMAQIAEALQAPTLDEAFDVGCSAALQHVDALRL
jgi:hypothetical protein